MLLKRPSNKFVIGSTNHDCNVLVIFAGISIKTHFKQIMIHGLKYLSLRLWHRQQKTVSVLKNVVLNKTGQIFLEFNSWEDSTFVAP